MQPLVTHLRRLGILSLLSLCIGAAILFAVGANCLAGTPMSTNSTRHAVRRFAWGSSYSVQAWLALIGFAVGCVAFGVAEAWIHLFNWVATRSALSSHGLDYGRYLNTLPGAPVLLGWRGLRSLLLLKYLLMLLTLAASVGYKFAIVRGSRTVTESLLQEQITLSLTPSEGLFNGTATPLLTDAPGGRQNGAFVHQQAADPHTGPSDIYMIGAADCADAFNLLDDGVVVTREVVMVATRSTPPGTSYMYANHAGYQRSRTVSDGFNGWIVLKPGISTTLAVVDYAILEPGLLEIRWAPFFVGYDSCPGFSSNCSRTPHKVQTRHLYKVNYAIAEVRRRVAGGSCATIDDSSAGTLRVIARRDDGVLLETEYSDGSISLYRNWVDSIIYSKGSLPVHGVSVFVRAVMAGWANTAVNITGAPTLGHSNDSQFGSGLRPRDEEQQSPHRTELAYPYFEGVRNSASSGCVETAALLFLLVAAIACVLVVLRVLAGPQRLTPWTAQHIDLAGRDGSSASADADDHGGSSLAGGYDVAKVGQTYLRLYPIDVAAGGGVKLESKQWLASVDTRESGGVGNAA